MTENIKFGIFFVVSVISYFDLNYAVTETSEIISLKNQVLQLEKIVNTYNSRVQILENKFVEQDKKIRSLESELFKIKPEIKTVTRNIHFLKKLLMNQKLIKLENEQTDSVYDKRSIDQRQVEIKERAVSVPVAFYAYLSNDVRNPGEKQTLVFDVVKTNTENKYNAFSGVFTVPMNGVYVFASSLFMDGPHQFSSYEIVKNGDIQGAFFVDADSGDGYVHGSMTVVIEANQGDIVYMRTGASYIYKIQGSVFSRPYARSSFAGWRI